MKSNSIFSCAVVMGGGGRCKASDLFTKRDTVQHRPHSDRDMSAKDREVARVQYEDKQK